MTDREITEKIEKHTAGMKRIQKAIPLIIGVILFNVNFFTSSRSSGSIPLIAMCIGLSFYCFSFILAYYKLYSRKRKLMELLKLK